MGECDDIPRQGPAPEQPLSQVSPTTTQVCSSLPYSTRVPLYQKYPTKNPLHSQSPLSNHKPTLSGGRYDYGLVNNRPLQKTDGRTEVAVHAPVALPRVAVSDEMDCATLCGLGINADWMHLVNDADI